MLKAPYILLAEDNEDDTFFATRCFAAASIPFALKRCEDGRKLVEQLQNCGQDLPRAVILDLKMPRMDGFEVLQWIRAQAQFKELPVIVLSASPLPQDVERAFALGATEYLVKPTRLLDLTALLKRALEKL